MPLQLVPPPAKHGSQQQRYHQKQRDRRRCLVEIGGAYGNLVAHRLCRQRVERADQDNCQYDTQEDIVGDNTAFAADNLEWLALLDGTDAGCKNDERKACVHQHQDKNEGPTFGIDRKSMHAGQYARTDKKRSSHRHGKGHQRQHDCPRPQSVTRGQNADRMQQSRRGEPRHERGIFNRVPEPPATPAQFIIGPIAARRDPQCQEYPCG